MDIQQLMGRYYRLRLELAEAHLRPRGNDAHVDRLSEDLAATERAIAALHPRDEQTSDSLLSPHH